MNILIVAAHPDDEVLGCGGTIAKLAQDHQVHILVLGTGVTSRDGSDVVELACLREQSRASADMLGAVGIEHLPFPDNSFDSTPLLKIVKAVEERVCAIRPEIVLTHCSADLNIDHVLTHRAVVTATRPLPGTTIRGLLAFPVRSSTEWAFGASGRFRPSIFVDITDQLETKLRALKCYESEMRPFPHPRSIETVRADAQVFGSTTGVAAAEAFELIYWRA